MSLPRYEEYKESGTAWLGTVPSHWHVQRLKYACTVFPSNVDKHSRDDEPAVRLCNYTDVYYNEQITSAMPFMEATASEDQIAKFTLKAGDTIITKDSETADDIAISAYVPVDLPGVVCGYHLSMIRPRPGTVGAFVKRLFDSVYAKAKFEVAASGLTRVGLGQYSLDNVELPFPPIDEQTAIATFLDRETAKIDALIAEQKKLINLLAEKRQATISHAVTRGLDPAATMKDSGVAWLGEVPKHWDVCAIRRVLANIEQGWSPECFNRQAEGNEWGVLKAGCVKGGAFNPGENKALPEALEPDPNIEVRDGDLLMSRASGSPSLVGSVAYVSEPPERLMLSDKIFRLHLSPAVLPPYFAMIFGSRYMRHQIKQAISGAEGLANNLPQSSLKSFAIAIPPIQEQAQLIAFIATELTKLDLLVSTTERSIKLLKERRSALIAAAVTGQIDVRGAVTQ